jgi:hypothetical protein
MFLFLENKREAPFLVKAVTQYLEGGFEPCSSGQPPSAASPRSTHRRTDDWRAGYYFLFLKHTRRTFVRLTMCFFETKCDERANASEGWERGFADFSCVHNAASIIDYIYRHWQHTTHNQRQSKPRLISKLFFFKLTEGALKPRRPPRDEKVWFYYFDSESNWGAFTSRRFKWIPLESAILQWNQESAGILLFTLTK